MDVDLYHAEIDAPIGRLTITANDKEIVSVYLDAYRHGQSDPRATSRQNAVLKVAVEQLRAYFAGDLRSFSVPLAWNGTEFQVAVWRALLTIPYGATASYRGVARQVGRPNAVRAVGAANGRNPISIIVPCHRVIGADGTLTGYGGGLPAKRWLLDFESSQAARHSRDYLLAGQHAGQIIA